MFQLESLGYYFDVSSKIWKRPEHIDIGYNDGDFAEERLAKIISNATDVSVFSSELRDKCLDWQTLYHLSSQRGNVLRPFADLLRGDVLEIGAGCGAISRFLGENGGNILALEGSQRRATIAASRTRDLDNVQILAERFDCFSTDQKFDAITLIGVLEYATMFGSGEHPDFDLLAQVKTLLKPDGVLFIAIENKLGLKYFAGAPEDHINKAMYGIEGRYLPGEPQTYGYVEIEKLLDSVGFQNIDVVLPYPDYKFPSSIITRKGSNTPIFDASALAAQSVTSDPQLPEALHFSLQDSFPEIFKNGLGVDLANSFIFACKVDSPKKSDSPILAWHYSTQRKKAFTKETVFQLASSGHVELTYNFFASNPETSESSNFTQIRKTGDKYYSGLCLSQKFNTILTKEQWKITEVADLIREWVSALQYFLGSSSVVDTREELGQESLLPADFIDAIPQNIIITADKPVLFDIEWSAPDKIPLGYLLFRGLLLVINQTKIAPLEDNKSFTRKEFIKECLALIGVNLSDFDFDRYTRFEANYQNYVTGREINSLMNWNGERLLTPMNSTAHLFLSLYHAFDGLPFSEFNMQSVELSQGYNEVRFQIKGVDNNSFISGLRLDPTDKDCWFSITSLVIKKANGESIWNLVEQFNSCKLVDIVPFSDVNHKKVYYSCSDDPQIYLDDLPKESFMDVYIGIEIFSKDKKVAMLQNLQIQAESMKAHADNIQAYANTMAKQVKDLEHSTSWKITAPLRYVGKIKNKFSKSVQILKSIIHEHGAKKIVIKGIRIIRLEGLRGVAARLKKKAARDTLGEKQGIYAPSKFIHYDKTQGYTLGPHVGYYCYIPPAKPENLEIELDSFKLQPFFSIVVPVYNTPLDLLHELISSIEKQWYDNWELLLVNDYSSDAELNHILDKVVTDKIKVINLQRNSGISGATNVGIEQSKGDYIVFTDHDDLLTVDCLYELALCINKENPDFIYSDEDKLSEDGKFVQPHFKPDWSPETMMSTMYTCHVSCVKKTLLASVGLLRSEFDGCQDWDFVLRVAEHTNRISHIAKVLYHWRIIPQSIASDIAAKDYVLDASIKVREDALIRRGIAGKVEAVDGFKGYFRVNYYPVNTPLVSIIIPTRDNYEVVRRCIESIINKTNYSYFEIIILDNGSVDDTCLSYLKEVNEVKNISVIRHDRPFNFSELNNVGVKKSKGDILLFLNDDTEVIQADWLERMIGFAQLPHVGAVGAKLLYPHNKNVQHAGIVNLADGPGHAFLNAEREHPGYFMRNKLDYNWLAVTGACLMMERSKFVQIGCYDESFPVAYNDVELCFRSVDAGYYNVVCQGVELYHYESVSRGVDHLDQVKTKRLLSEKHRLYDKHPAYYQYDPYFNVNLHPNGINFEVPF